MGSVRLLKIAFVCLAFSTSMSLSADEFIKSKVVTQEEENTLTDFVFQEIIPAFGGLRTVLLNTKPSGSVRIVKGGFKARECNLEIGLRQLETIRYGKAFEIQNQDDIDTEVEFGGDRKLNLNVNCGLGAKIFGIEHFLVRFYVTDQNQQKSSYRMKVKALEQQAIELVFHYLEGEVKWIKKESEILVSYNNEIISMNESHNKYIEEGIAKLPVQEFLAAEDSLDSLPEVDSSIEYVELMQRTSLQHFELEAEIKIELPSTDENGERVMLPYKLPVKGKIYLTADGEVLPDLDVSLGE